MKRIFLASSSKWRADLLRSAGFDVACVTPDVRESHIVLDSPDGTALARARAKAMSVVGKLSNSGPATAHSEFLNKHSESLNKQSESLNKVVLGADQVAHLDNESFGKPKNNTDWFERLVTLRGRVHTLSTGVSIVGVTPSPIDFVVQSKVEFRGDITDEELLEYIAVGEARGCAGGYMAEGRGAWLIKRIDGDWSNVIGLPVLEVITKLRESGWRLP